MNDLAPRQPLVLGRIAIPAENVSSYQKLADDIHALLLAGKSVPRELRVREYILQGMTEAEAELLASCPETAECSDARAVACDSQRPFPMNAEQAVAKLVREGAAMTPFPGSPPVVVGLMQQLRPGRWFWWESCGEDEFAGHVVDCDRAEVLYGGKAVQFLKGDKMVGYLTEFEEAANDDEEVSRMQRSLVAWEKRYQSSEGIRAFLAQEMKIRGR